MNWIIETERAPEGDATISTANGLKTICTVHCHGDKAETENHARLIAAAPAMRDALLEIQTCARGEIERPVTQRTNWNRAEKLLSAALAMITEPHRHKWVTDKSGLIDTCTICGEERA